MKVVVSILSDQLIPNVLFIKQMDLIANRHIFLSSEEMEKSDKNKSNALAKTLNLNLNDYRTVIIDQNNPIQILNALNNEISIEENTEYVINITGGTKMMSQMTHRYFAHFGNVKIYYWPIGEGYVEQVYPEFKSIDFPEEKVNLDLKTYFQAYGYNITYSKSIETSFKHSQSLMDQVITYGDSGKVKKIKEAGFPHYKKSDKGYYTGGWFEEWLYHTLKTELNLNNDHIGFNVKIKSDISKKLSESDNEIDVAFVFENSLYILECKVYSQNQINGKRIMDAIYKISSIKQSLGLRATAFVTILSLFGNDHQRKININDTKRLAGVKDVFSLEDLENKEDFIVNIKKSVGYE